MRHSYWADWVLAAVSAVALLNLYAFVTHSWWGEALSDDVVNAGWMSSVGACIYAYVLKPRWAYKVQASIVIMGTAWRLWNESFNEGWYVSHLLNALRYSIIFCVLSVPLTPAIVLSVMAARRAAPA